MTAINTFEDIIAWQKAQVLTIEIYKELKNCKDYAFRDQLQRASVSIMNNIAEGFERNGNKEFRNFLFIAKGSSGEVRSMLTLAGSLGYISPEKVEELSHQAINISKMLSSLIKKLYPAPLYKP
jgi:four helix bundle protein